MIIFILSIVVIFVVIYKIVSEKIIIKFPTFLRKGFKLNKNDKQWGVYTFTR